MQAVGTFAFMMDNIVSVMQTLNENKDRSTNYPRYVKQIGNAKMMEREQELENMGTMGIWPNAAFPDEAEFGPGYAQQYTQTQWSLSYPVTRPMEHFDMQGFVAAASKGLVDAGPDTLEFLFSLYLDNATATTGPLVGGAPVINCKGGDGLAMCSTAHTYRTPSASNTWANRATTTGDPSEATFTAAYAQNERQLDNTGKPLGYDLKALEVPPELYTKARVALEARLQPTTANNAPNQSPMTMKGGLEINENKWLSSTSNWFIFTTAKNGMIKCFWGWKPTFRRLPGDRTSTSYLINDMSLAHGFNAARGIFLVG